MLFVGEEFFFSRKGMRPARLPVDCRDADLHLRNHRSRQTDPYLRGKQSVHDEPLRSDPETGEGARRVISAGYNLLIRGKSVGPSVGSVGSH